MRWVISVKLFHSWLPYDNNYSGLLGSPALIPVYFYLGQTVRSQASPGGNNDAEERGGRKAIGIYT